MSDLIRGVPNHAETHIGSLTAHRGFSGCSKWYVSCVLVFIVMWLTPVNHI